MMKKAICISLFCISILLMGCGDDAASHSDAESKIDINTVSSSESHNTSQPSEVFSEPGAESFSESGSDDLHESSESIESSSCSAPEESLVTSDVSDDNITDVNSEVEIDFSEFE